MSKKEEKKEEIGYLSKKIKTEKPEIYATWHKIAFYFTSQNLLFLC